MEIELPKETTISFEGYKVSFMETNYKTGIFFIKIVYKNALVFYKEGKNFLECSLNVPNEMRVWQKMDLCK